MFSLGPRRTGPDDVSVATNLLEIEAVPEQALEVDHESSHPPGLEWESPGRSELENLSELRTVTHMNTTDLTQRFKESSRVVRSTTVPNDPPWSSLAGKESPQTPQQPHIWPKGYIRFDRGVPPTGVREVWCLQVKKVQWNGSAPQGLAMVETGTKGMYERVGTFELGHFQENGWFIDMETQVITLV